MSTHEQKVDAILNRGVIKQAIPSLGELRQRLLTEELRIYIGADPTGSALHLSHAKNFMLLEEFRQLGHKVFVLFGDLTACIGDPSDRTSARAKLTREQARANVESWVSQIKPIINFDDQINPAQVVLNSTWFDTMSVTDLIELVSNATVQQMLERDMFVKRMKEDKPIFLHEFLYPMFQGFDSVALEVDIELCGTDQIFNALVGRTLLKKLKGRDKMVVAVNLMENPVTGKLMSKTNKTGVFLGTDAVTMFGEIMSQPDEMIEVLLINNTRVSLETIRFLDIPRQPFEAKLFAAEEIVKVFYGKDAAKSAREAFRQTFSQRNFPTDAVSVSVSEDQLGLLQLLKRCMPGKSNGELRRLIEQHSVTINGEKTGEEINKPINLSGTLEVKVGKRNFFRIN